MVNVKKGDWVLWLASTQKNKDRWDVHKVTSVTKDNVRLKFRNSARPSLPKKFIIAVNSQEQPLLKRMFAHNKRFGFKS